MRATISLHIDYLECWIMKVAIVGSRNLHINNLGNYLPENVTEIVSGGAKGIDECIKRNIKLKIYIIKLVI